MTRFLPLALLLLFVSMSGCDNTNTEDEAPELISPDLFEIDTNFFNSQAASKSAPKENFVNGALRVWPVSLVMTASLALPAIVTNAALQDQAEFADGAWQWESVASFNSSSITFGLTATPDGNGHNWSSSLSFADPASQNQLDNFELFTGRTQNGGTEGNWQLFLPIDETSTNVLNATFTRDSETDKAVTFSIPATAAENGGDSVTYLVDGDNNRFEWTQVGESMTHTVEWNSVTGAGSISATNFKGGIKSCWDQNQDDAQCPTAGL